MSATNSGTKKASINVGINKTLLTPCRRIGLSRKTKPLPNTFSSPLTDNLVNVRLSQSLADHSNVSPTIDNLPLENYCNKQVPSALHDLTKVSNPVIPGKQSKKRGKTFNSPLTDNFVNIRLSQSLADHSDNTPTIDNIPVENHDNTHVPSSLSELTKGNGEVILVKQSKRRDTIKRKPISKITDSTTNIKSESTRRIDPLENVAVEKRNLLEDDSKVTEISSNDSVILQGKICVDNPQKRYSTKRKISNVPPQRQFKRKLSMKRSADSSDTDDDDARFINLDSILSNSSCDGIISNPDQTIINTDCSVSQQKLSNEKVALLPSIIDNVLQLELIVHEKEARLSRLQQIEIYRNLHNTEDLNKLTNLWKSKCQDALRDLLGKLRQHTSLDMPVLLKNLNVPSNLISYNCEEDVFI